MFECPVYLAYNQVTHCFQLVRRHLVFCQIAYFMPHGIDYLVHHIAACTGTHREMRLVGKRRHGSPYSVSITLFYPYRLVQAASEINAEGRYKRIHGIMPILAHRTCRSSDGYSALKRVVELQFYLVIR